MSLATNVQSVHFGSFFEIDKVLGTYTGSFTSTAPTSGGGATFDTTSFNTGITESTFFRGVFSVDGGVTWNDFNSNIPRYTPGFNLQTISVSGKCGAGTFSMRASNFYDYVNSIGNAYTVLYKVVLFAKPDQGRIDIQTIGSEKYFDSRYNYQKVSQDYYAEWNMPAYGRYTRTIDHNLGYIPKVSVYFDFNDATYTPALGLGIYDAGEIICKDAYSDLSVTTTQVSITKDISSSPYAHNVMLYVRIYHDY